MSRSLFATADPAEPVERCARYGRALPERSPNSPAERRCQGCRSTEETRRYHAGEPVTAWPDRATFRHG